MEWSALRAEIIDATARVGALLRALPNGDVPLERVTWTAAETGAHLVSLPPRYREMLNGPTPYPASLADDNARALALVADRDPRVLADRLTTEVDALLAAMGSDGTRPIRYFRLPHTVAGMGGVLLTELLIHGADLALVLKRPWPISRAQALACLRGVIPALTLAADTVAATTLPGTYHLHIRGGDDWTIGVRDGLVTITPGRPPRPDARLSADPVVFLRSGYGQVGALRVALTGAIFAYGRKPWMAGNLGRLFRES